MGVAGAGKTTIGQLLAADLGWPFYDSDQFHPQANVEKMARGIPLTDEDRVPWLEAIRAKMQECLVSNRSAIFASSALKQTYRDRLQVDQPDVRLVYLRGGYAEIAGRMEKRSGHFM